MLKKVLFTILFLFLVFYGNVNAQCSITGATPNASTYNPNPCALLTSCGGILYIGNGTNGTSLQMNSNLNLTCLGPIQLVVNNNANIDFTIQNYDLLLAAGSSITFIGSGKLVPYSGNDCSSSDRIQIGGVAISNCKGTGGTVSFEDLVGQGGFNIVNISPTSASACGSASFSFTATAVPSATATEVRWYSAATGGTLLQTTSGNTSTYITPTISTTTTYYAEATIGASTTPRKAVVATINPLPSAPTVSTITQPTCTLATGSVILSGLPAGNWTINPGGIAGTGTTSTISGLAAGTYNFTVSNGTCTSSATAVVINPAVTNTWNGTAWSTGSPPTSIQAVVFSGNYPPAVDPNVDIVGCSCTVNTGRNVIINTGRNLIITNSVVVVGTGTLTFEDSASLVQINNASNSGSITYKRNISSALTTDYTYWSSPVVNQNLNLSSYYSSGLFYSYNDFGTPEDWQKETAASTMIIGKGYIVRGPATTVPPGIYNATFTGVPNNGSQSIAVSGGVKSALIGNPYPSAIDADTFLSANSASIDGTLYFWTHNTSLQDRNNILSTAGSGALAYTSNDYAVYNLTGGVVIDGVTYVQGGTTASTGGAKPTGKIAAGQSFFTTTTVTGGTVNFTNAMRLAGTTNPGGTGTNQQFFKTRNPNQKTLKVIEKHRIWLNLSNFQGAFKQTLIGYVTGATNEYNSRFDGESFDGNEFVDFYSINQDKNLVIQGRALPFDENDEVPLGYRTTISGEFTINIDEVDGLLNHQNVFLEDKLTNKVVNLKEGSYTFNTTAGTFDDRFVLRYTDKTLGTTDFNAKENNVFVSIKNKQIQINSFAETIDKVTIFDLLGRQIYQKNKVNNNHLLLSDFVSSNQTLIVKTSLQNGTTVTEKVIY